MANSDFYYYFCIAKKVFMDYKSVILAPIVAERERFNAVFDEALQSSNPLLNEVLEHVRHTSGKKMRPMLVLLAAKLFGEVTDAALHAAVALELLHNASLVHDDVVDESHLSMLLFLIRWPFFLAISCWLLDCSKWISRKI